MAYTPPNPNGQATSANSSPVVIASDQSAVSMIHAGELFVTSTGNSSTTQLAAAGVFTGAIESVLNVPQAQIMVTSDQPLSIQVIQYIDGGGVHLTDSDTFTITGGSTFNKTFTLPGNFIQIKVTNTGASTTTTFDLQTTYGDLPVAPPTTGQFPKAKSISVALASDQGTLPVQDSAAETSLSTIATDVAPLVASAAGGYVRQDSNATIAKETGGNLATIAGAVSGAKMQDNIAQVGGSTFALGQQASTASLPVVISSDGGDLVITGQSGQVNTINNIIPATASATATTVTGYKSASIQINSTGAGGTYIFEGSNDNSTFFPIPVQAIATTGAGSASGAMTVSAVTASATNTLYVFPINFTYLRVRIASTITGGLQAFTRLSNTPFTTAVQSISQSNSAYIQAATYSQPPTTPVSALSWSGAGAGTATTSFTPSAVQSGSMVGQISITAIGASSSVDVTLQESTDNGVSYRNIYQFPRLTATGTVSSPPLPYRTSKYRLSATIAGASPAVTGTVFFTVANTPANTNTRQIFDRTITLTSTGPSTVTLPVENTGNNVMMSILLPAATTAPTLQMQGSDDNGATWYNIGSTLAAVASATTPVTLTINNVNTALLRANVTAAGTGITTGFVLLRSW